MTLLHSATAVLSIHPVPIVLFEVNREMAFMSEKSTGRSHDAFLPKEPKSFFKRLSSKVRPSRRTFLLALLAMIVCTKTVLQLAASDSDGPTGLLGQLKDIPSATLSDAVDEVVGPEVSCLTTCGRLA